MASPQNKELLKRLFKDQEYMVYSIRDLINKKSDSGELRTSEG